MMPAVTPIPTAVGEVNILWVHPASGPKVKRILLLGDPRSGVVMFGSLPSVDKPREKDIRTLIVGIQSFLAGQDVRFDTGILDRDRNAPV